MKTIDLHPNLLLAYSEVADGNIDFKFGVKEEVKENRKNLFKQLKLNSADIIEGQQIHFNRILSLDVDNSKMWRGLNITGVDGFITDQKDIFLFVRIADCVPVVLFDPQKKVIAVVHAGWKGSILGIHTDALARMIKEFDSNPKEIIAWIGPSAQSCCYISDKEPEQIDDLTYKKFISKSKSGWSVDVPGYILATLHDQGILKKNTHIDSTCTVESETLFSHQKAHTADTAEGRFAVIAKLR